MPEPTPDAIAAAFYTMPDRAKAAAEALFFEGGDFEAMTATACRVAVAEELRQHADVVQGWRENGDDEPDFRTFRDHLRARADELDPDGASR